MRRIIKTDENGNIHIAGNSHTEIWMTAWEMAELFNATVSSIQKEIKAVRKSGIFADYEVCTPTTTGIWRWLTRWPPHATS